MDRIIDFTDCKIVPRPLGGSDRKFRVQYKDKFYMLKFTEEHVKKSDISTSHENNAVSEYISSHIAQSMGLLTHNTVLGFYNEEICVGCEDYRSSQEENIEFQEFMRTIYGPGEAKKIARIDQLYETYNSPAFPSELKIDAINRYWDTFVVDALVGNFDRHTGNWGLLSNNKTGKYSLAPTYDYGSTLFPILSDKGAADILRKNYEIKSRCLIFPSATLFLTKEKTGKPGYYDMLSSGYDSNCSEAVERMYQKIDLKKINGIIDNTPLISDIKRTFYKQIIKARYDLIIEPAYERCLNRNYDIEALHRLQNGISIDNDMLKSMINSGSHPMIQTDYTVNFNKAFNESENIQKSAHNSLSYEDRVEMAEQMLSTENNKPNSTEYQQHRSNNMPSF